MKLDMYSSLQIIATRSMEHYAQRVFEQLCTFPDFYSRGYNRNYPAIMKIVTFSDGEIESYLDTSIRGKDVFLFSNIGRNECSLSPSEAKLELYYSIDAIKRSRPGRLVLFEPYCSPSRSDRSIGKNSVGFWVHYKILMSLGVDHIITYQLHSDKSKTVVDPCKGALDDIPATPLLMEYMCRHFIKTQEFLQNEVRKNWLFCSVDSGGESFARMFAEQCNTELIVSYKNRDYTKANTVESINILTASNISGKEIWIVDDMIDTGGSIEKLVREINRHNVKAVHVAIIHPVLSGPALQRLRLLYERKLLNTVITTDTLALPDDIETEYPFLHVVNSAKLSAEITMRLHEDKTLSPFFDIFDVRRYLKQLPFLEGT